MGWWVVWWGYSIGNLYDNTHIDGRVDVGLIGHGGLYTYHLDAISLASSAPEIWEWAYDTDRSDVDDITMSGAGNTKGSYSLIKSQ